MKIYFIGIGGIGVSALARYYLAKGHQVSGSDLVESEITENLKESGANITIGPHQAKNLPVGVEKIIYSVAVELDNPELKKAEELKIETQSYPQALGELTRQHFTIAVCGAHGKGTTTALISLAMIKAGLDPTVIIGTNLKEFGNGNCRVGKSEYLVVEADEYGKAFLNYQPQMIVITNINKEHLDCYQDLEEIIKTFQEFVGFLPKDGTLIANKDNENVLKLSNDPFSTAAENRSFYSLKDKEAEEIKKILKIPGEHNVSNALGALAAARKLGISDEISLSAFGEYQGSWRRFEVFEKLFGGKKIAIISDYAHHPNEIKATLAGAKEKFPKGKIWAVFQPHQYQRTYYLFDEFLNAFNGADEIILTEIYSVAGREKKEIIEKVSSQKLAEALKKRGARVSFVENFEQIPEFLKSKLDSGDVVLVMGAGSIYKIADKFV